MMNDYVDYYNYMNNMDNLNTNVMPNEILMPIAGETTQKFDYSTDPYKGFSRGNMFDNLYKPYKNYRIRDINATNDKEGALLLVQMYAFAAHDLSLYLDVNPNDVNAINLRAQYMNAYKDALNSYENIYGPICETSDVLYNNWSWNSNKWPWEVGY